MTRQTAAMRRYSLGVLFVTACAVAPALALGDYVGAEVQYWRQSMDGEVRVDGDTLSGTTLDPQEDLGIDRADNLPAARVWVKWFKRNYLIGTYFDSSRSGEKVLTSPILFADTAFLAGENVRSGVDTKLTSLVYGYNFLDLKIVKTGFRIGADRIEFDGRMRSTTSGTTATSSESANFPVLGLGIQVQPLPLLRFTGEITGIKASFGGDEVSFTDARVQAEVYVAHFIGFHGGYRQVRIDADLENFGSADVTEKGPYLGMSVRF